MIRNCILAIRFSGKHKTFDIYEDKNPEKISDKFSFELEPHACKFLLVKADK